MGFVFVGTKNAREPKKQAPGQRPGACMIAMTFAGQATDKAGAGALAATSGALASA
jgi:hypothetical protein